MVDVDGSAAARARLDEVRRRLYRPDASAADRLRYAELQEEVLRADARAAAAAQALDAAPGPPPADEPSRDERPDPVAPRRRRLLLPAALLVGLVVAAAAIGLSQAARETTASSASVAPSPTGTPAVSARFQGDAAPAPVTTAFPVEVDGDGVVAQRTIGSGGASVPVDVAVAPPSGGRMLVALSSSDPSPVGWKAERPAAHEDHSPYTQVVAESTPALRQGVAVVEPVDYRGMPPTRVSVQAPAGTGWTLVVAFARTR